MLSIWGHDKESRCPSGKSACLCTFLCLEYCTLFSAFAVIDLAAFSRCYVFFCFAFFFFKSLLVSSEMTSGWKMQQYWLGLKHTEARIINDHRQLPLSTCMRWSFSLLTPDYVEIQMGWFFLLLSPFFFSFSSDDQIFILLFQILFKSHIDSSPKPDHFITSAHPLNWESEIPPKSYELASIRWFIVTLVNSRPNSRDLLVFATQKQGLLLVPIPSRKVAPGLLPPYALGGWASSFNCWCVLFFHLWALVLETFFVIFCLHI